MRIGYIFICMIAATAVWINADAKPRASADKSNGAAEREFWVETMITIAEPVFRNLAAGTLRQNMPVEVNEGYDTGKRKDVTHLEALGRALSGVAPWLELGPDDTPEGRRREEMTRMVVKALANAVDQESPDYLPFYLPHDRQPLVDAAYVTEGLLRAKNSLWSRLDSKTRERLIEEFKSTRKTEPWNNNWVLFSAMVEAALLEFTGECDMAPIRKAVDTISGWYKGDGWYGDGPWFHLDYYNSYVIHPMMKDVLDVVMAHTDNYPGNEAYRDIWEKTGNRLARYAEQQERLISPEGAYPMLGRSSGYRYGAFHALAQAAMLGLLPDHVKPAQVREALTAVIERQTVDDMFDEDGWLRLGFCGHQPEIMEDYGSTGSAYICSLVFLPLGLPADDEFWSGEPAPWTQLKAWGGMPLRRDHALE